MPKGKREHRQRQRKAFHLECLEDRVALSTSNLFGGASQFDLALRDTVQHLLHHSTLLSWYPTPGEGGSQYVSSTSGSVVAQSSNGSSHSTHPDKGHHQSQGSGSSTSGVSQSGTVTSTNSESGTAASGSSKGSTTKTTVTNDNQGGKNSTSGSVVTTSSATTTSKNEVSTSSVTTYDSPVEVGPGQSVVDVKIDSHGGDGPTDKGGSPVAGQTNVGSRTTPDSPAGLAGTAAVAAKTYIPYLQTEASDGNKTNGDAVAVIRQVVAPGTMDPSAGVRGEITQLDGRKNADFTAFGRPAKWVEENVVYTTATFSPRATTGTASSGQEAAEEDALVVETIVSRDVLFRGLPVGAAQLLDQLPIDAQVVDQAMQQFMHQLDNLGSQLDQTAKSVNMLGWLALGVVATTTIGSAHRRRLKKRHGLQMNRLSSDSLSWMTDFSTSD
jgi:hypothetical protein